MIDHLFFCGRNMRVFQQNFPRNQAIDRLSLLVWFCWESLQVLSCFSHQIKGFFPEGVQPFCTVNWKEDMEQPWTSSIYTSFSGKPSRFGAGRPPGFQLADRIAIAWWTKRRYNTIVLRGSLLHVPWETHYQPYRHTVFDGSTPIVHD